MTLSLARKSQREGAGQEERNRANRAYLLRIALVAGSLANKMSGSLIC